MRLPREAEFHRPIIASVAASQLPSIRPLHIPVALYTVHIAKIDQVEEDDILGWAWRVYQLSFTDQAGLLQHVMAGQHTLSFGLH